MIRRPNRKVLTAYISILDPIISAAAARAAGYKDPKDKTEYPEAVPADWQPSDEMKEVRSDIVKKMTLGYTSQNKPRVEFNDLSLIQTTMEDLMAFNTYQPNDGDWPDGDQANSWRSTAIRPIERNKVMSVAGHAAGRLGFLKLTAIDEGSKPQEEAAEVLNSLLEYAKQNWFQPETLLGMTLASLYAPKAFVHLEFSEVYRPHKKKKVGNKWTYDWKLDEDMSGFQTTVVPPDQLFFENIFERDIQKQAWIIWRRVQSFSLLAAKYGNWKNWDKVRPGMHLVFNDPNANFYYVYDPNMWSDVQEEVIYWSKDNGGCKLVMVGGVVIGEPDAPNPREDGAYPFAAWGYQMIRTNFLFDKSLVSSVKQDAKVLNTLYPLIMDGAVLSTIPPTVATGSEIVGSDVIIPGMTTTLKDKDATLKPLMAPPDIGKAMAALTEVEKSLDQTVDVTPFGIDKSGVTAYQISVIEQQKEEAIGPFRDSLLSASTQLTRLVMGDILQHFTAIDADKITGDAPLVYKTFLTGNGVGRKRIRFEDMSKATDPLKESYKTLEEQGGMKAEVPLYRVNPEKFRDLKFMLVMSDDVLKPKSENVRFTRNLETFDKAIMAKQAGANVNLDEMFKDFVLTTNEKAARNPDKYMAQAQGMDPMAALMGNPGQQPGAPQPPQPHAPGQPPMPKNPLMIK